ncbi:glucose dehydrogenase [FAD, quinone]-like [Aphidius gifuensis]|nr:glucose dehydrogenase [FAD, quinone]-like [Aphidius gifuensis]
MVDERCTWPRGKSLGGTTTINTMVYTRGNKLDFDKWADMGNYGWDFKNVLPYFKKSEKFRIPGIFDPAYHGYNGNVDVEYPQWRTPFATAFLEAGQTLGYNITDVNGADQIGFSYIQLTSDQGARCSASKAYLRINRSNLDIVTGARVLRILINSRNQAYGVEYEKNGIKYKAYASKEVVLSAGTIDSAKLLMLSGIGPRDHLNQMGIPVIKDAKVGYNLQEHIGFWGLSFVVDLPVTIILKRISDSSILLDYIFHRKGPISSPAGAEAIAFMKTKYSEDSRPDVELFLLAAGLNADNGRVFRKGYGITDKVYDAIYKPIEGRDTITILPVGHNPKSRGRILLKSKDPYDKPIINGNFFNNTMDIEVLLEGIKYAIELVNTEPFKKYGVQINSLKVPGCEKFEFGCDDYWRCAIRQIPLMENHECGTIKMGPKNDPNAVVDPELRVYGIDYLRVVDASVMPVIPVGHITADVYMIGEKGADMIKYTWQ